MCYFTISLQTGLANVVCSFSGQYAVNEATCTWLMVKSPEMCLFWSYVAESFNWLNILGDITLVLCDIYLLAGWPFGRLDWLPWRTGGLARGKNTRLVLLPDVSVPDVSSLCIVAHGMTSHPSMRVRVDGWGRVSTIATNRDQVCIREEKLSVGRFFIGSSPSSET